MNFLFRALLPLFFSFSVFSEQTFSYVEYELPNNIVREGIITFNEKKHEIDLDVNIIGKTYSSIYKTTTKKVEGFNIWDIKPPNSHFGISIFTLSIDVKILFTDNFKISDVETLDRTHPQFNDQMWNFSVTFKGYETINFGNKTFETIHLYTKGERPTGPGHCMYGGFGVINIESWYDKNTGKLVKQIFTKRNCRPYDYKFLSREVIQLTSNYDKNNIDNLINNESFEIKLHNLKKLRDDGLIDEETFKKYQNKILSEQF